MSIFYSGSGDSSDSKLQVLLFSCHVLRQAIFLRLATETSAKAVAIRQKFPNSTSTSSTFRQLRVQLALVELAWGQSVSAYCWLESLSFWTIQSRVATPALVLLYKISDLFSIPHLLEVNTSHCFKLDSVHQQLLQIANSITPSRQSFIHTSNCSYCQFDLRQVAGQNLFLIIVALNR